LFGQQFIVGLCDGRSSSTVAAQLVTGIVYLSHTNPSILHFPRAHLAAVVNKGNGPPRR